MFDKTFVREAAKRAIRTVAQTLLAALTVGSVVWDVDWTTALGLAATAGLASVLTSIATAEEITRGRHAA